MIFTYCRVFYHNMIVENISSLYLPFIALYVRILSSNRVHKNDTVSGIRKEKHFS